MVAFALLTGLAIGSFLNVCIHRLPKDRSIVWPGSQCPGCAAAIVWYDNIPVLSWLWLRGRCRTCHAPISVRHPAVELVTAGLAALALLRFGPTSWAAVAFVFSCALLVVSLVDLDEGIIPDAVSLPGILIGLAVSALVPGGSGCGTRSRARAWSAASSGCWPPRIGARRESRASDSAT